MIKKVMADGKAEYKFISELKARCENNDRDVTDVVSKILADVKENGDKAVAAYTLKFDGSMLEKAEISAEELKKYAAECDSEVFEALERASENIKAFHKRQLQQSWLTTKENGVILGQRIRGLKRVGIYVPGGTAAYPSSVLMNAIPAKIAGVEEIVMVTPPGKNGRPNPDIMAAALIAGVDRVFLMGGAQAVAALAYGTESVPKVDKIVGPGNIFVATAKKLLFGTVDIDMIAGPSEILVVADKTARADYLAADLMSQAEHDILASAILLTDSDELAEGVIREIEKQSANLSRKDIIDKSLNDYGAIIVCRDIREAVDFANILAPEHLEVCVENPMEYIGRLDNAGSVFLGNYSPEPLGDYYAGPNHVLPTSGTARFFSPLSVDSFIKKSSFIYYTKNALLDDADDIIRIANAEGLTAHANSIIVRKENETKD
ncbi:MAG: histidinol dehydrogenase [Clostridia bacterium]|nr:histidinol dehydrogenase [Clostridia bacterium]